MGGMRWEGRRAEMGGEGMNEVAIMVGMGG
jgi:hypothetical protein